MAEDKQIPEISFETGDPRDAEFFRVLKSIVEKDCKVITEGERKIHTHPDWVRDHIHEMKAWKWWESDLSSFIDRLIELQPARGFFHEILSGLKDYHAGFVKPEFVYRDEANGVQFIRLELEADIEYLMVEAAYFIWQATGDKQGTAKRLPALEKGLRYNMEDPTRWDPEHGLLMRPFTIDTWDFTWGVPTSNRGIDPDMPMAIMHGDNSGLYRACLQMAEMTEAVGDADTAAKWREKAEVIRDRANKLLWNGRFYMHEYHLDPVDPGCDESDMLSLSNTYDINRGLPTHEMAVSIIDEYRERGKRSPGANADWYTLDPPYPIFAVHPWGEYINGGVGSFVAGELAKAAFRHGREDYGVEILRRLREITEKTGTLQFIVGRDGRDLNWGPRGWGAAAVLSAMMEGLAGITDKSALFESVEIAPRYPAAGMESARVCLRYGASDAYVIADYKHDPQSCSIRIALFGSPRKVSLHVLLPEDATPAGASVDGKQVEYKQVNVEKSVYCDFTLVRSGDADSVAEVAYRV